MNNNLEKLEDSINPILFNDLRKTRRSSSFWLNIALFITIYLLVFFILIVSTKGSREYVMICYRVLAFIFLTSFIAIPLELRSLSLNETNNDNIFFVFMSNITASKLINGKLLLGIIYNIILLTAAIPVYIYIYFSGGLDFIRLIRIFFLNLTVPIPAFLFLISEGLNDGRNNKAYHYANGIGNYIGMMINGGLFVNLAVYIIRDQKDIPFFVDLIVFAVLAIISLFIYLFLYSSLVKAYPMSESSSYFVPKARNTFAFKSNKIENQKPIKEDNNINIEQTIKTTTPNEVKGKDNVSVSPIDNNLVKKTSPSIDVPKESNINKENIIFRPQKERISIESIIKIIVTVLWAIGLLVTIIDKGIAQFFIRILFFIFPILAVYVHSRDKIYDNRNKLEIPDDGLKKLIKFPFVSGYVNGVVWLSILGVLTVMAVFIRFGVAARPAYSRVIDYFDFGYFVLIGFMLNIFSWCFLGRFISEFFVKENSKENNHLNVMIILIVVTAICPGLFSKEEHSILATLPNYFVPSMPSMIDYFFFKKDLAFICNLFFIIVTIIPHLKPMYEQCVEYFNNKSDFDE